MGYYSQSGAPKGGFLKAIGKVAGTVGGFVTGGIPGAIAGHKAGGKIGSALTPSKPVVMQQPSQPVVMQQVPTKAQLLPGILGRTPAGQIVNQVASWAGYGPSASTEMVNGQCPVGYHPNKQASAKGPARSYCVRNRSMNPTNGRAIGRAVRRIKAGADQYKKVLRVLGKPAGRVIPRTRKRK